MNSSNIYHINPVMQHRQEAIVSMHGIAFTNLVHNIIREYGKYRDANYSVDVNTIDISDKRLVLSHLESAEWYEWACETPSRTNEMFNEHAAYFQKLVDDESYEVYREDQEEMRAYK